MANDSLIKEINDLKKSQDALILAHYYESGEIQDIADFVGDSLALAQKGEAAPNKVLLVAGVVFMGESAKILSPEKTVLVPDLNAGCSLVDHSPFQKYLEWRQANPSAIAVTYVNSSAEVKAITDVCVTSSNAELIVNSIPKNREILFGPDRNLGRYLSKKLNRPMTLWPGACEVHVLFSESRLQELKAKHPKALVLAHPECDDGILAQSDVIGSTSALLAETKKRLDVNEFIVATENGIFHQMQRSRPDAQFFQAPAEGSCACNECPYMKLNSLEKIRDSLRDLKPQIQVKSDLLKPAQTSLQKMLRLSRGESVQWSDQFHYGNP